MGIDHSERGFSLLEVLVAVALIGTALVALLSLGNRAVAVQERVQRVTQATLLAQEVMTSLERGVTPAGAETLETEHPFPPPFATYRWRLERADTPLPAVTRATVTVLWGEAGRREAVELTSFLAAGAGTP